MNQQQSIDLDIELMSAAVGYSLDQLMEMAGLGVAMCTFDWLPKDKKAKAILILIGPGNNGGDGLVAARYLKLLNPDLQITCCLIEAAKVEKKFPDLLSLLRAFQIDIISGFQDLQAQESSLLKLQSTVHDQSLEEDRIDLVILDCVFGFSFKPPLRGVYIDVIDWITSIASRSQVISVDIPSGWDVEQGPISNSGSSNGKHIVPDVIISLTAPKLCVSASDFQGAHYVTGRFVPAVLAGKFKLALPSYKDNSLFVRL